MSSSGPARGGRGGEGSLAGTGVAGEPVAGAATGVGVVDWPTATRLVLIDTPLEGEDVPGVLARDAGSLRFLVTELLPLPTAPMGGLGTAEDMPSRDGLGDVDLVLAVVALAFSLPRLLEVMGPFDDEYPSSESVRLAWGDADCRAVCGATVGLASVEEVDEDDAERCFLAAALAAPILATFCSMDVAGACEFGEGTAAVGALRAATVAACLAFACSAALSAASRSDAARSAAAFSAASASAIARRLASFSAAAASASAFLIFGSIKFRRYA